MRSLSRDRQKVWFSKITEKIVGTSSVPVYEKPTMLRLVVSATSGTPEELAAGIVPDYDRYIVRHKIQNCAHSFEVEESMVAWIDVTPKLDEDGNLSMSDDEYTPETPPDYRVKRILDSQKAKVCRYGIVKIRGGADG